MNFHRSGKNSAELSRRTCHTKAWTHSPTKCSNVSRISHSSSSSISARPRRMHTIISHHGSNSSHSPRIKNCSNKDEAARNNRLNGYRSYARATLGSPYALPISTELTPSSVQECTDDIPVRIGFAIKVTRQGSCMMQSEHRTM
jgi:hypothetical protein